MSEDILAKIVRMRREDISRLGLNFGIEIPEKRRGGHTEFLGNAGAILEVSEHRLRRAISRRISIR